LLRISADQGSYDKRCDKIIENIEYAITVPAAPVGRSHLGAADTGGFCNYGTRPRSCFALDDPASWLWESPRGKKMAFTLCSDEMRMPGPKSTFRELAGSSLSDCK
jgi:hypothetical protein